MATTPQDRLNRRGQPSLALPLLIVALAAILVIALLIAWPATEAPEIGLAPAEPASVPADVPRRTA
jgi:hypothetical protein